MKQLIITPKSEKDSKIIRQFLETSNLVDNIISINTQDLKLIPAKLVFAELKQKVNKLYLDKQKKK